jgi:hypothetical protein
MTYAFGRCAALPLAESGRGGVEPTMFVSNTLA